MSDHLPCLCLFNNVYPTKLPDKYVFKRKLNENKKPRGFMQSCFPVSVYFKCLSEFFFVFWVFFINFCWTNVHFVEPLIAPVLDFVCPSSWVSKPEWISCLHSFLLVCCDPEGHNWCDTCLFHQ